MANQRSPDGRLVYLHCSSIFRGANAQVRKLKKIVQLLQQHKASIEILTREFSLPAIAAVVKELLEDQIFESLSRARLRYPELFQPSETREAEREASETEVIRMEAEAAQDIVLTSDDEGADECLEYEQGGQRGEPEGMSKDKVEVPDEVQTRAVELCTQSTFRAHQALTIPRLHPVYLPFKTQHNILVSVQSSLEECCLEFGNTWVPDLMEAQKWHEAESIELTQWTKRFLKHARSLPAEAIKPIAGKSIAKVLFETSTLRHSAVHRLPTSAGGIVNMLHAAISFAEALNDSKRAEKIAEIKTLLEASIEEIVQHQNLLECKLTDQLEDIARRRAELDELESSSIEEMLATDKEQRVKASSALESVLVGSQQVSNPCPCSHVPSFDGPKVDSEAGESITFSGRDHEQRSPGEVSKSQNQDQGPFCAERPRQSEELEKDERSPWYGKYDRGVEEEPEDLKWTYPDFRWKGKEKMGKNAAVPGWDPDIPAAEEAPVLVDEASVREDASPAPVPAAHDIDWEWPRKQAWNCGPTRDIPAEPYIAAEEATPPEEPCFEGAEVASPRDEPYVNGPEEESMAIEEDAFPAEEAVAIEDPTRNEDAAILVASQAIDIVDDVNIYPNNQHANKSHDLDDPYEPKPEADLTPIPSAPTEDTEFIVRPPSPALSAVRPEIDSQLPPLAPSSTGTPVLEAAAPEPSTEDSHTIMLKILNGSKVLRCIVFIRTCMRTAILNEARAHCAKRAQDGENFGGSLAEGWHLALVSLNMDGYELDMSTYEVENLSFLVQAIGETGIPTFTLRMSRT